MLRHLRPPAEGALCHLSPTLDVPLLQDVDMMDQNGMTPLMWAAYRTHRCVCAAVWLAGWLTYWLAGWLADWVDDPLPTFFDDKISTL